MKKYNALILTDHSNHSAENSVYAISNALAKHPLTNRVDIASRGILKNDRFFQSREPLNIWATAIKEGFSFTDDGSSYLQGIRQVPLSDYDLIWLRLPPPLDKSLLDFFTTVFADQFVINSPAGIYQTGSKAFLVNFKAVCPPIKVCNSIEDIIEFKKLFPIVLKPFREYGGKGIVRIEGEEVWDGNHQMTFKQFASNLENNEVAYLGVKFLKNVSKGDKRIIVVNGKVLGASLRLPPKDSWLCNVAMGGSSHLTNVDQEEYKIIETVNPILSKMGIAMYGLDTLVDDDGKRILSEINTTSIGGLPQVAQQRQLPLVEEAIDLIWKYFLKHKRNDDEV